MIKFDILEAKDVFGDDKLKIFNRYGTRCALTDFAILTGAYVFQFNHTKEGTELKDRTCCWWLKSFYLGDVFCVDGNGYRVVQDVYVNHYCVRPVTNFSSIEKEMKNIKVNQFGVEVGEYGMLPNSNVDVKYSYKLEKLYQNGGLNKTGKIYKTDTKSFDEYKHHGNRFIRIELEKDLYVKELNDGAEIKKGNTYWLKVEPIEWIIDREKDIVIPLKGLVGDIKFDNNPHYYGKFEDTNISKFLNEEFINEIIPVKLEEEKVAKNMTMSDIFNYNYKNAKNLSKKEKQDILLELINSDDLNLESARSFAKQMGNEYLKIFDALKQNETTNFVLDQNKLKVYKKNK